LPLSRLGGKGSVQSSHVSPDPSLLDYKHAELLFIGEDSNIAATLGDKVDERLEAQVEGDVAKAGVGGCSDEEEEKKLLEEMKKELAVDKPGLETAPVAEKKWK